MAAPTESLIGVVANNCDTDNFTPGEIDNEIFKQGTGSIGLKISATTNTFITTTLSTGPYDFSSGGGEEGDHIIMWADALNSVNNFGIYLQDTTTSDNGRWTIAPPAGYTGGFFALLIDPATDFSVVSGTWTTGGNVAQLSSVAGMGTYFDIAGSIMGNFHNALCDQYTVGTGIRSEDGDVTTPGTFQLVRDHDEGTIGNNYGWWTSAAGAFIGRGKLIIGPASGNNNCKFLDDGAVVIFADAAVAAGFYEIETVEPGSGTTDVDLTGMIIRAEDPATARWTWTSTGGDVDISTSLLEGFDIITMNATTNIDDCTIKDGNQIIHVAGASFDGNTLSDSNAGDGVGFVDSTDLSDISNCDFTFSDGHAIEYSGAATAQYTFTGNTFNNYGANGTNDAAIYNTNTSGTLTIDVAGGVPSPTVRTAVGGTTIVNNTVDVDVHVEDTGGNNLENIQVIVDRATQVVYTSHASNNAQGDLDFEVQESILADVPNSWLAVRDASEGRQHWYRLAGNDGTSTFTLPTKVGPFATTSAGGTNTINDTGRDVTTLDIVEGDTVRNETDGSWATIVSIDDADTITTTDLQGGTNNDWGSGDNYSVHSLALAYNGSDTAFVPLINEETDASGDVTLSFNRLGDTAVTVRARSSTSGTRYFPGTTSGTITTTGFTGTIVLVEDTIVA